MSPLPQCHDRLLGELLRGELDRESEIKAEQVLTACPLCSQLADGRGEVAPLDVLIGVSGGLAAVRLPQRSGRTVLGAAAAILLMIAGGLVAVQIAPPANPDRQPVSVRGLTVEMSPVGEPTVREVPTPAPLDPEVAPPSDASSGVLFADDLEAGDLRAWRVQS